jgi:hypothetical protein
MKKVIMVFVSVWLLFQPVLSLTGQEESPVTQCARGVTLFRDGDSSAALPLLEDGFTRRCKRQWAWHSPTNSQN